MAEYYGVRHLSPACAFYVREFLDRTQPDIVLIEGPSDLSGMINSLCDEKVKLPSAILAYTETAPVYTIMYPMAEFSPEYQAMKWAVEKGVPAEFCDLPSECLLYREDDENVHETSKGESVYEKLEKISGFDNDTFWEYNFEYNQNYEDFMRSVEEYGKSIREFSESDERNELREAYMRKRITESEKQYGKTAVITGAFHTFGIKDKPFSKEDEKLLKKIKKTKGKATLMPYSYFRLSSRSGYGAGNKAPAYYETIWKNRLNNTMENCSAEYLAGIAEYQRKHGFSASSAEVIEGLRLAETLSAMNGSKMPALSDLRDSAVTCLGHGSFGEISLACADVEIGTKIGELPQGTVCTSVQDDFMRQLKELKLERFRTAVTQEIELDLRENLRVKSEKSAFLDLNRSFFINRLKVAGVNFGTQMYRSQDNATWAEKWELRWSPETEIEIVEASLNGDTVEQSARTILNMKLSGAETLSKTAETLSLAFKCGMSDCVRSASTAVQTMASECSSVTEIGKTIGELSSIVRFGNIRRIDPAPVIPLIQQLFLKFCLQLNTASVCDRNASSEIVKAIAVVSDSVNANDFLESEKFINVLSELSDSDYVNPLISGFACALLTEKGNISNEKLSELISRRLSKGTPANEGALWFEGLSKRNRRSLIGRLSLWEKLCGFIEGLDDEEFKPVLVSLRRTFSDFSPSEKNDIAENIGEILGTGKQETAEIIVADITEEEQQSIDELDDFDFDDI